MGLKILFLEVGNLLVDKFLNIIERGLLFGRNYERERNFFVEENLELLKDL